MTFQSFRHAVTHVQAKFLHCIIMFYLHLFYRFQIFSEQIIYSKKSEMDLMFTQCMLVLA